MPIAGFDTKSTQNAPAGNAAGSAAITGGHDANETAAKLCRRALLLTLQQHAERVLPVQDTRLAACLCSSRWQHCTLSLGIDAVAITGERFRFVTRYKRDRCDGTMWSPERWNHPNRRCSNDATKLSDVALMQ